MTESEWTQIGERLREARIARGLGQSELGERIGVDRTAVVKLESGQRRLTALELVSASDALHVPMSWLVSGPRPAMVSRRRVEEPGAEDRRNFDLAVELHAGMDRLQLLVESGHLAPATLPTDLSMGTHEEAEAAAAIIRKHLHLDPVQPLAAMSDIAARLGLFLTVLDSDVDGASMTPEPGLGVAVLGGQAPAGRRRFTCAHELGHHLLGDEYDPAGHVGEARDDRERRIDTFALALLLPLAARAASNRSELIELSGRYRVSWSAAAQACHLTNVGPTPTKAEFVLQGIEIPEDLQVGHPSSLWRQAVLRAREARDITDATAIDWLGEPSMSLDDLPRLEDAPW